MGHQVLMLYKQADGNTGLVLKKKRSGSYQLEIVNNSSKSQALTMLSTKPRLLHTLCTSFLTINLMKHGECSPMLKRANPNFGKLLISLKLKYS